MNHCLICIKEIGSHLRSIFHNRNQNRLSSSITKAKHNMSNKHLDSLAMEVVQPNGGLYLDQLDVGVTSTIVVMICRVWDVNAITGRYLSTDFVVSDGRKT